MGKGTFGLQAEKITLKCQHAQNLKQTELYYKLLRLVLSAFEIWDKSTSARNKRRPMNK